VLRSAIVVGGLGLLFVGPHPTNALGPEEERRLRSADSAAASLTRANLLKVRVRGEFSDARLGDVLKEFAAQAEMRTGEPVFWTYGADFPFGKKISFSVKDEFFAAALDSVLSSAGGGLGYVVVSKDGDKHDGWVLLTTGGERGMERQPPTAEEESTAAERLALARKLIDAGKPASARPLLEIIVKRYQATRAGKEAAELLGKIGK
jgi:hypothetical protein